jgi:alanine racemase
MLEKGRTCAEIDLGNLVHNLRAIQRHVAPSRVIPVVKADAYGHGALPVARAVSHAGFGLIAVAQFEEAMTLRNSGIVNPILIFGRLMPGELPEAVAAGFHISLFGSQDLDWLEKADIKGPATVHVNLETGMGRVGVIPEADPEFFGRLTASQRCCWEGLYSHFSTADEADKGYANLQLRRFNDFLSKMRTWPRRPAMIHMANSGGVLDMPESRFDAVRTGIIMYGHYPSTETSRSIPLKPVMAFKTYVAHVRTLPGEHPVSYGRRWVTEKATRIAVIPVGYADGLPRAMTNRGEVLINGSRYPMVGTITMDQTMIHVGDGPVAVGDDVLIWGDSAAGCLSLLEIAEKIGTIPYELTCGVSPRVERTHVLPPEGSDRR